MLEKQFIQFFSQVPAVDGVAVPACMGAGEGVSFYVDKGESGAITTKAAIVTADGATTLSNECQSTEENTDAAYFGGFGAGVVSIEQLGYFRIRVTMYGSTSQVVMYSNLMKNCTGVSGLSRLEYYCTGDVFGFPFMSGRRVVAYVPILLKNPQFEQEDKVYTKSNGENVVLYSTIRKEYSGETEYISEAWHDKIVTALGCDQVYINGERVTKSESYNIDWDNYTFDDCTGEKVGRATFSVKTNVLVRNSNCG